MKSSGILITLALCASLVGCKSLNFALRTLQPQQDKATGKWGYADGNGHFVITPQFEDASAFSEGLAAVTTTAGKCGYIDMQVAFVINPQYFLCDSFTQGLAVVTNRMGKSGYIDKKGKLVIRPQFDLALPFGEDGTALVVVGDQHNWLYFDKQKTYS